jgi:DNA-binding transcriptional MocR family regulator
MNLVVPADARNLADGNPDPAFLPDVRAMLPRLEARPMLYGRDPRLPGLLELAREMFTADRVPAEHVAVVSGALDGIERILLAHLRPGDRVALEDPCFPRTLDLCRALALIPVPVEIDDRGPRPESLRDALARRPRALIITPRAQNPTGAAVDPDRMDELEHVLEERPEMVVIEDDHAALVAGTDFATCTGRAGTWAVVRSFAKGLGPDLRIAVMAGDATTVARVQGRQVLGAGWVSTLLQELTLRLLSDRETRRLLERAATAYARRRTALIETLGRRGLAAHGRSGMNVWVPVNDETATTQILLREGWAVSAGQPYRLDTGPAVRVTTANLPEERADDLAAAFSAVGPQRLRTYVG